MKSSLLQLQTALYQRLSGDSSLRSKISGVYDLVPDGSPFPYITLGEDTSVDDGTKTYDQEEVTHTLHIWSQYKGKKEAKEILSLALEAITSSPLTLGNGFSVEFSQLEFSQVFTDEDGKTQHGVARFRFKIKQ